MSIPILRIPLAVANLISGIVIVARGREIEIILCESLSYPLARCLRESVRVAIAQYFVTDASLNMARLSEPLSMLP